MHLVEPVRGCIDSMVQAVGAGLKSMVLDGFTTGVVSAGYSRSELLLREIYLFERIETLFESSERLNLIKCIVLLRPTRNNIELLCQELGRPHFRSYYIYFTCRIGGITIKKLAEADECEVVRSIKELPLDFHPLNPFLFTLRTLQPQTQQLDTTNPQGFSTWLPDGLDRTCSGLSSALIALRINPLIRYQTQSSLCKSLAERVSVLIKAEALANLEWRKLAPFDVNSLLLIVDRRSDLVTPILNKWFYYPMINEQFNVSGNIVSLMNVPTRKTKDPKEMLLSIESDRFFGENYSKNYGEISIELREALNNLKSKAETRQKVETIADMKQFIDEYPETKRHASNLHNHVFLMSELARLVREYDLIKVSECEQELACNLESTKELLKRVKELISNSKTRPIDAIRLISLFVVCRPQKDHLKELLKSLEARGDIGTDSITYLRRLKEVLLHRPMNPLDTVQQVTKMIVQGVKGVDNVLTHHKPTLRKTLEDLNRGNKLSETEYSFLGERYKGEPPRKLVIFFVGGVTFDEALEVDLVNKDETSGMQTVIGGTSTINFASFMNQVLNSEVEDGL